MKNNIARILILLGCFLYSSYINAQLDFDTACRTSLPFCSSSEIQLPPFANTIGDLDGLNEVGCLNTTPNPAWYYIRIDEPGELVFEIQQWIDADGDNRLDRNETRLDVDFVAWGPFATSFVTCADDLDRGCDVDSDDNYRPAECVNNVDDPDFYITNVDNSTIADCSYGRDSTETFTIPNAQTGEYYLILITNFADQAGVIALDQTNEGADGAGTTDCSVLDPGLGPDIATCGEFPVVVQGRFPDAVTFTWERADIGTTNFVPLPDTDPFINATTEGVYRLRGYDLNNVEVADSPDEVVVLDVSDAIVRVIPSVAEESFACNFTITAELELAPEVLTGDFTAFEYLLERYSEDQGVFLEYRPFQSSAVFEEVPAGDYQIVARYANCPASEVTSDQFMILGYNKYFTPNGDGFNDTWTLVNIEDQPTALIYIFDRHGKLLKQLIPGGPGWDGTFNGRQMPSTDYWFRVEFNEPTDPNMRRRIFKGNFSLIR